MDVQLVKLNNGTKMPIVGLGTAGIADEHVIIDALKMGYRHIDTAKIYGNEEVIGKAIKKSKIPRKELFITTKIWNGDHEDPMGACEESLQKLQVDYVDLYLIHWPVPQRNESWKVFEKILKEGKAKAIGVSNFTINHLNELFSKSKTIPAVNQVEFSLYLYQKELMEFCKSKGIQLVAYSPLTRGRKLDDERLNQMAEKYSKTTAQIMLRWIIQHDIVAIPKSNSHERLKENLDIFDFNISQEDMKKLDRFDEEFRIWNNPSTMK